MAILELFKWKHYDRIDGKWIEDTRRIKVDVPAIYWKNHEPWGAANAFLRQKADKNSISTAQSNSKHILDYANWLESESLDWLHFPMREADRCLYRYRGYLIHQRDHGALTCSTIKQRMNAVVNLYKFSQVQGWIKRKNIWNDVQVNFRFYDETGFQRTASVWSTDLAITCRQRNGLRLEDGLLPLSVKDRDTLLRYLQQNSSDLNGVLVLIHMLGFFTGARSGTIRTIRTTNLLMATNDPFSSGIRRMRIGPGTDINSKFNVTGDLLIPETLFKLLERYAVNPVRLERELKAENDDKTLLFLTRNGTAYSDKTFSALISEFRKRLIRDGHTQFHDYKFHQTRSTYGTVLATFAINLLPNVTDAICFVRDCMLHKDELTTWRYIKFVQRQPIAEAAAKDFFEFFTGTSNQIEELIAQVTYEP